MTQKAKACANKSRATAETLSAQIIPVSRETETVTFERAIAVEQ